MVWLEGLAISLTAGVTVVLLQESSGVLAEAVVRRVAAALLKLQRQTRNVEWLERVVDLQAQGRPLSSLMWSLSLLRRIRALRCAALGIPHHPLHKVALKRALDLVVATGLLVVSLPGLLLTAVAIKLESKGPSVFRQLRVGFGGKAFPVYKFRTLRVDADFAGGMGGSHGDDRVTRVGRFLHPDDRVTRVGRFLRATGIDEMPMLVSVIRGHMSLVGPRPLLPFEIEYVDQQYRSALYGVKPGMTGPAQIFLLTSDDYVESRREMDIAYSRSWSIVRDFGLLLRTPAAVVMRAVRFTRSRRSRRADSSAAAAETDK